MSPVPTHLLDLSDDIIDRIAYFVHRDYDVPLPSFNPHWANFVTELDRGLATDYLAFRASCKRVRDICSLKGLHLFLRSWQRVLEWMADAPDSVVKGIRRLSIDIEWKFWPPELKKLDENAEIDMSGHGIYPLIPTWSTITSLLSRLTSLEELYLSHSPLCQHRSKFTMTSQLKCPPLDFLPQLKSLAFEIRCSRCAQELPGLFIPACTKIQHIKMFSTIMYGDDWQTMFKVWEERHPDRKLGLKTLALLLDNETVVKEELQDLAIWGSELRELHMIKCDSDGLEPGFFLGGQRIILNDGKHGKQWIFKLFGNWITGLSDDEDEGDDWEDNKDWTEFLEKLSKYPHLETFDCVINPHIDQGWPPNVIPHDEQKASEYKAYQKRMRNSLAKYKNTQPRLASAMAAAAGMMVEKAPSLKNGYFWQYPYDYNSESAHIWRRWSWYKDDKGDIQIEPVVELFASEWMVNREGEGDPDYQNQDPDDD